ISMEDGAGLVLKDVALDGTGLADGNQTINYSTADVDYGAIRVEGSEIRNYVKGLMYLNVTAKVASITFHNNIIYNTTCDGRDSLNSRRGAFDVITFTTNTVYNSAAGSDFIRYDVASSSFDAITTPIKVHPTTLQGVSKNSSRRLLYVRFNTNKITFS